MIPATARMINAPKLAPITVRAIVAMAVTTTTSSATPAMRSCKRRIIRESNPKLRITSWMIIPPTSAIGKRGTAAINSKPPRPQVTDSINVSTWRMSQPITTASPVKPKLRVSGSISRFCVKNDSRDHANGG